MSNNNLQHNREQARRESVKNGVIFHGGKAPTTGGVRQTSSVSARKKETERGWGWDVGKGGVDLVERILGEAEKKMAKIDPSGTALARNLAKFASRAPGRVLDIVELATAPDKMKAGVEFAGGRAGGAAGALGGATVGGGIGSVFPVIGNAAGAAVGAVVGGVGGGWGGGKGAGVIYDHRDDIAREIRDRRDSAARGVAEVVTSGLGSKRTDAMVRRGLFGY